MPGFVPVWNKLFYHTKTPLNVSGKTVYGSAFYHFDRTTEVYLSADRLSMTDGYRQRSTFGYLDQTEFGVGLRLRF